MPAGVIRAPVVTPRRAILDGIGIHLGHGVIHQAIETAAKRGLITRNEALQIGAGLAVGAR